MIAVHLFDLRRTESGSCSLLLPMLGIGTTFVSVRAGGGVAAFSWIDALRAVLPIQAADDGDLAAALEAVRAHRLPFWDAMLWASAQRAGVRCLLTEDLQDGFILQSVKFVNPFKRANDRLIDEVLPPAGARR